MAILTLLDFSAGRPFPVGAGSTVSMTPASGTGPYYLDVSSNPFTSTTTATTDNSPLILFLNLAPGAYSFTATVAGLTCSSIFGWPGTNGTITGPSVKAGEAISI